ncbi:MAG: adenosine deaminase [Ferruginibacter sp.]|nr:adenosine deaminase [Ferruginibacter sp.]
MNFQRLPKVELHLHLDCGLSYKVVSKIDPSVTRESYLREFIAPAKCANLADFLTRAVKGYKLMQTKEQLQLVVYDLFNQLAASNTLYAEIRFAPLQHLEKGLRPYEVVAATEAATAIAVAETGIEARLILCTLRHFTEEQSMETVKLAQQFKESYVAGFDIAADEAGFPVINHINAFKYAKEKGIHCTAHAGEAKGAESVWETLRYFGPTRIGHGVRSIEDPKLVEHLKKHNIHLEICPSCNVQIGLYDTYHEHPVDQLYRAGVSLSINTDAPTIVDITLTKEYQRLQEVFGWTMDDFYTCNVYALQAAFIPVELKDKLLMKLKAGYNIH